MRTPVVVLLVVLLSGCAERARIASVPSGARVFIEGSEVGVTPYILTVGRSKIRDIPYRIELEGYRPVEGTLRRGVAPGRVFGAIFTVGILYIFRSPLYIQSTNPVLAIQPGQWQQPPQSVPIEDRLKKLQELRDDGVLSPSEYERQRENILNPTR